MTAADLATNFLSPPILFFVLGLAAAWARSDLEFPAPLPKVLSLYLLFAIGFRGGAELGHAGAQGQVWLELGAAVMLAAVVPFYVFLVARRRLPVADAAALAATYGSISAVTFITAAAFLDATAVSYGGHMVAAMALMESPAIVIGVFLARRCGESSKPLVGGPARPILHEAFCNGSVFLLLGSLAIGALTGDRGAALLQPLTVDLFPGVLALFLLDLGLIAARRLRDALAAGWFAPAFALGVPLFNALLAWGLSRALGMEPGNAFLLIVLAASASYIAVPAAMRTAVPEANPSLYVALALAVTFPFNLLIGLPLYLRLATL
jgi:hypothetical protein